jgi:ribosome-binding ATPase YchF (GTP1/OBG family)
MCDVLCHDAPQALRKRAAEEGCEVVVVSAKVESELNGMPPEEAAEWLDMLGVEAGEGGGLAALIRATYKTLGLQTYFTTGKCQQMDFWRHCFMHHVQQHQKTMKLSASRYMMLFPTTSCAFKQSAAPRM